MPLKKSKMEQLAAHDYGKTTKQNSGSNQGAKTGSSSNSGNGQKMAKLKQSKLNQLTDYNAKSNQTATNAKSKNTTPNAKAAQVPVANAANTAQTRSGKNRGQYDSSVRARQDQKRREYEKANYYQAPSQRGGGMKRSEPKEEGRGFLARFVDSTVGGAKGSVASNANAATNLYQQGQKARDFHNQETLDEYNHGLDRARQELVSMLEMNRDEPGYWTQRDIQQQKAIVEDWQRKVDAVSKVKNEHIQEKATQESYKVADMVQDSAARDIERAKEGLNGPQRMLVDAWASTVQSGLDAGGSVALGAPGSMIPFGFRAYGGASQEARRYQEAQRAREEAAAALEGRYLAPLSQAERDKQLAQQTRYGLASMAKEIFTEKIGSMTLPGRLSVGGGAIDNKIEQGIQKAVEKFAKTEAGRRALGGALSFGAGAVSEGMEELIGDWIEWQLPRLYGGDVKSVGEVAQDSLYDFLVGATSGAMGGAVTPSTYAYGLDTETLTGRQNQAIDQAYQTMQDTGLFSPESNVQRQQSRKTVDFTGDRLGMEKTTSVRQSIPTEMVQDQQAQTQDVLRDAAREVVSNREAERVLNDPAALRALEERTGQAITGTKSQQRQAVKAALEEQGRQGTDVQTARVQETPAAQRVQAQTVPTAQTQQTAPAAQIQRAARTAADTFGENGAKAYRATAGETSDPAGYYAGFAAYYQAGINGVDQASVNTEYAGRLSEGQKFAAYSAGQNDAAVSLKREQAAAPYAKSAGTDSGLVYDDFVRDAVESGRTYTDVDNNTRVYLTAETAEQVNQVAKALGLRAQFVDSVFHGKANAKIEGDTVFIEKNNPNPVLFLMGHEATHRMQQLAPTEYRALRDMIANEEQDRIQDRIATYAKQGVDLTIEDAMDEITADRVGRMMDNGSYLDEFIQKHRKDRTVLEKLRDAFHALVDKLTGKAKRQAETAEGKLTAALEAAEKKAGELKKENAAQEKGKTRYSVKEYTDEEKKQHVKDAVSYFGRTYKWAETGYITTDGKRLDFSGRHEGGPGGYRSVDHRDIRDALGDDYGGDDYSGGLVQFMAEGNIRISPESGGINLSVLPTKAQMDTLSDFISKQRGEVILDLDTPGGDTVSSTEYPRGTHASKVLADIKAYFADGTQPQVSELSKFRYSLKNVPPVKPTSDEWRPGATFDEVKTAHPTLFALDADEADTRNPTQITGTVKSYRKIYDALQAEKFDGTILDASSGLGYGTRAGREEYGFDVDDIEPFPDAKYKPNYTDYSALDKTYDVIISNAVLNVMPQDLRDAMVVKIGKMLNPGGRAFINVRGTDVKNAGSKVSINDDLMEYFISNTGSYQKGFTSKELVSYLKDALGDGFTVEPTRKFGAVSAIVTRDGRDVRFSLKAGTETHGEDTGELFRLDEAEKIAEAKKKLSWDDAADMLDKQEGLSYRFYSSDDPMSRGEYAMFADDPDSNGSNYGGDHARAFSVSDRDLTNISELTEQIIEARHETDDLGFGELDDYESVSDDEFAKLFDPEDIVDSAAAWDNEDLVTWFAENIAVPLDLGGVKTEDGAIVFDRDLIRRNIPAEIYYAQELSRFSLKAGTETQTAAALHEEERLLREQTRELAQLQKENRALTESRDYWKGQTQRTKQITTDKKAVAKAAKELVDRYGAQLDGADITPKLQALYDYMASGTDGKDELTYSGVRERAEAIARTLIENAVETDDGLQREYSELRRYLRDTALVVTDDVKGDITDYGDFRKRNLGRMKLVNGTQTNIDQVYQELSYNWPEFFDEQIQTTPTDQLLQISMVLNDINRVTEYNPYQGDMQQATAGAANEIIETFFDLPQTKKTFADRAALRLEEAKAKGKLKLAEAKAQGAAKLAEQKAKGKQRLAEAKAQSAAKLEEVKAQGREAKDRALLGEQMAGGRELAKQKRLAAERLQKVRDQNAAKLAQLREANRARVEQVIAKERQSRERQLEKLKERYETREEKGRERRAARELRAKITRHVADLSRKLLKPTDQQHIPEVLRKPVAKLLESINLESAYAIGEDGKRTKGGEGDPVKRTKAFLALREAYERIAAEDGSDIVFDPSLLGGADVQGSISAVLDFGDKRLMDMSREELEQVWQVVRAVEYSVSTAGKVLSQSKFAKTQEWAAEFQRENQAKPRNRSKIGAEISLATPYTFFAQYGEAGHAIYRMLRDAQDHQQVMVNQVEDSVKKLVDEKTVQRLGKETMTFQLADGNTLTLTRAQMMELYALSRRKQALDHLLIGGVVQPEVKSKKIQRGTESLRLSQENLSEITGALTADEVKIAEGLQELASTQLAGFGNEASMRAYGYRKFTEKNYWPIRSAQEVLHSSTEKNEGNVRSIKNIGMAKATRPKANNAVDIGDIFETFARHTGDMVDYAAWLCPMEDANRLFNFQFRDEDGNLTGKHIKGLLEQVGGKGAQKYWRNLMDDIQNGIGVPGDDPLTQRAERLVGSFKGAAVGANLRVIIQQPTAFFRAGVVLDPQDMAKGLAKGVTAGNGWKKALKYSPIAMRKDAGGFDISAPATMKNTLFGGKTALQTISDKAGAPAGAADAVTWGKLWNACEWAVARKNRALRPGSDAFYQEVARQFAEVIDQTQVVDGVLQRSNIMRSSNGLARQATAFMGEPIMSLNLLLRSYNDLRHAGNGTQRTAARKTLGRAALALTVTNVVNALAQSLIDAARDDDEDKKYWERFWAAFTGVTGDEEATGEAAKNALLNSNVGQNLNPLTWIPFVQDVISLMQGYEVSRSDMEVISGLISAGKTVVQNIGGKGQRTQPYAVKQLVVETARLFGVPVKNLTRDIWGLIRSWAVETDNVAVQYEMEKAVYNIGYSSNRGRYLDILYRALEQGDLDSYQHIRADLMDRMELDGQAIDSGLKSRYEKAVEKDPDYTLPQKSRDLIGVRTRAETETEQSFDAEQLSAAQYQSYAKDRGETYRAVLDTAAGYAAYDGLDDEDRNRLETAAWTYAEETALAANSGGKAPISTRWVQNAQEAQKEYGIKPGTYALLKAQVSGLKGIKDAEGKTITNSKGLQIMEVIYNTKGLNDRQRAAMAEYLGVGEKVRKLNRAAVEAKLEKLR